MFRKMRRFKQQISEEKCVEILTREPRGVMAFAGDGGYPYAIPLNFVYDGGKLYFHCAPEGHKLDAIRRCDKVSFCVMDKGYRKDGDWALNIKSVIVFGRLHIMESWPVGLMWDMSRKYTHDDEYIGNEIEKFAKNTTVLELEIEHMSGKLVNES